MNISVEEFYDFIKKHSQVMFIKTKDFFQNYDYAGLLLKIVVFYSFIVESIQSYAKYAYDNYDFVKEVTKRIQYGWLLIVCFFYDRAIEPYEKNWISISMYYKNETSSFFHENFHFFEGEQTDIMDEFKKWSNGTVSIIKNEKNVVETLISMKYNDQYTYRIHSENSLETIVPSNVRFLSIEYTYPSLKNPIVLNICPNEYIVGNEILSITFIKRMMEYQYNAMVFHEDYVINIMDNNIQEFQLKKGQYVILHEDTYEIKNNKTVHK